MSAPGPRQRRPKAWAQLAADFPDVARAYEALSEAVSQAGPLDAQARALVKVAVSVGRGSWRTVHAHSKKALAAGVRPEVLRHVALLALPTLGLPAMLDALRWIDESIAEAGEASRTSDSLEQDDP